MSRASWVSICASKTTMAPLCGGATKASRPRVSSAATTLCRSACLNLTVTYTARVRRAASGRPHLGRGVPLGRVLAAVIFLRVGPPDLVVRDDAIAAQTAEVLERVPALVGVLVDERLHPCQQPLDAVPTHRVR